ncbi:hypothetical protein [Microbacterium azadirachtae]|uniref:hypothetical protein n=1 Tax=Microbacterium azadirachtae TaxID=582680 RepID=UPI003F74BB57
MNKKDENDIDRLNQVLATLPIPQPRLQPHEYAPAVMDYRVNRHREMTPFGGLLVTLTAALVALVALINSLPKATSAPWNIVLVIMLGVTFLTILASIYNRMLMSSTQAALIAVQTVLLRRRDNTPTP